MRSLKIFLYILWHKSNSCIHEINMKEKIIFKTNVKKDGEREIQRKIFIRQIFFCRWFSFGESFSIRIYIIISWQRTCIHATYANLIPKFPFPAFSAPKKSRGCSVGGIVYLFDCRYRISHFIHLGLVNILVIFLLALLIHILLSR